MVVSYFYYYIIFRTFTKPSSTVHKLPHLPKLYSISKGGIFEAGFGEKVAFSWPSVDRFGKFFWGLMTLGQVKRVPNFC